MAKLEFCIIALVTALSQPGPARAMQAKTASEILDASQTDGGLIVQIGCGDGRAAVALRPNDRYFVYSFDADGAKVETARRTVRKAGLSESVWVDRLGGSRLPLAENMANLVISENLGAVAIEEVMRILAPGGLAYIKTNGKWVRKSKAWPAEIDEWTHWLHGPDNNAVAADTVAGPPRRLKWIATPLWSRSHDSVPSVTSVVSAQGRIFSIVDEAPASMSGAAPVAHSNRPVGLEHMGQTVHSSLYNSNAYSAASGCSRRQGLCYSRIQRAADRAGRRHGRNPANLRTNAIHRRDSICRGQAGSCNQ